MTDDLIIKRLETAEGPSRELNMELRAMNVATRRSPLPLWLLDLQVRALREVGVRCYDENNRPEGTTDKRSAN